jgi:hypothetical protein
MELHLAGHVTTQLFERRALTTPLRYFISICRRRGIAACLEPLQDLCTAAKK